MGKTFKDIKNYPDRRKQLRVRVDGKRRAQVDTRRLARVLIELAQAQAEAEAAADQPRLNKRGGDDTKRSA